MSPPYFKITDLSAGIDGVAIHPADINDHGQIVGKLFRREYQANGVAIWHAFLWQAGEMTILPTLGGATSVAQAINNRGDIVGSSRTAGATDENPITHAFLYRDGIIHDLGTLGGPKSFASDISDGGYIVGSSLTETKDARGREAVHGFFYNGERMVDIGHDCLPSGVNARGQVVGKARRDGWFQAFVWEAGNLTFLGTLGRRRSFGEAINAAGEVAGYSGTADGACHGFLWTPAAGMIDLGVFDGKEAFAWDLNDRSQVVGALNGGSQIGLAYLWQEGWGYILNNCIDVDSRWTLRGAIAISNSGEIIGTGARAFLLTPE